jgi:hypothetical protein
MNTLKIIPSTRPDGAVILKCTCGHRSFADSHGKAVCPECGAVEVVDGASVEQKPATGRTRAK